MRNTVHQSLQDRQSDVVGTGKTLPASEMVHALIVYINSEFWEMHQGLPDRPSDVVRTAKTFPASEVFNIKQWRSFNQWLICNYLTNGHDIIKINFSAFQCKFNLCLNYCTYRQRYCKIILLFQVRWGSSLILGILKSFWNLYYTKYRFSKYAWTVYIH